MHTLQFQLSAYPDEIFGSWVARNRLHNGEGAWIAFARSAGLNKDTMRAIPFDMPTFSKDMGCLTERMGISFEEMLLALTTLPYWLSFGAAPLVEGVLPGTNSIPFLQSSGSHCASTLRFVAKNYRADSLMEYCPQCIESDLAHFGEPFWHRSHQVPTIFYCPEHNVPLRSTCPQCGKVVAGAMRIVSALSTTCSCGYPLGQDRLARQIPEIIKRLSNISLDALANRQFACGRRQFREVLRSRSSAHRTTQIVSETLKEIADFGLSNSDDIPLNRLKLIEGKSMPCLMRAPALCIALAALDIPFSSAREEAEQYPQVRADRKTYFGIKRELEVTVKSAKDALLREKNSNPSFKAHSAGVNYWAVRILAPEWYEENFHPCSIRPLPTIREDRSHIRALLERAEATSSSLRRTWELARLSSAGQRARIRDLPWFDGQRKKHFAQEADQSTGCLASSTGVVQRNCGKLCSLPTLSQAKSALLHYHDIAPSKPPSRCKAAYWVLRLKSPQWLIKHFPKSCIVDVPSIQQDRKLIRQSLSALPSVDAQRKSRRSNISGMAAAKRAQIRDFSWYRETRERYLNRHLRASHPSAAKKPVETQQAATPAPTRKRSIAMARALKTTFQQPGLPLFPSISILAIRSGLTYHLARDMLRRDGKLRKDLAEAKRKLPGRRLQWAISKLLTEQLPLRVDVLMRVAKVRDRALAHAAIAAKKGHTGEDS